MTDMLFKKKSTAEKLADAHNLRKTVEAGYEHTDADIQYLDSEIARLRAKIDKENKRVSN